MSAPAPEAERELPSAVGLFLGRMARWARVAPRAAQPPVDRRPVRALVRDLARLLRDGGDDLEAVTRDERFWELVCGLHAGRPRVLRKSAQAGAGPDVQAGAGPDAQAEPAARADDDGGPEENDGGGAIDADDVASLIGTEHEAGGDEEQDGADTPSGEEDER